MPAFAGMTAIGCGRPGYPLTNRLGQPIRTSSPSGPWSAHSTMPQGLCSGALPGSMRSEENTSELQSLMRISYAVFCLKTNTIKQHNQYTNETKQKLY